MNKFKLTVFFIFFTSILSAQNSKIDFLIKNVSIVTMTNDQVLTNKSIAVDKGKIVDIFESDSKNFSAGKTIDGKGKYIMPSLSDAHVHLPGDSLEVANLLLLDLKNGVTKLRSMRGKWEQPEFLSKLNIPDIPHPDFFLSAPPIHRKFDLNIDQLTKYVDNAKVYHFDFIKILSVRDAVLFEDLDSLCRIANLPLAGHYPSNVSDSIIFHSQINDIEHLGGLIGVSPKIRDERLNLIKENDVFICPTLSWYVVGYGQMGIEVMRSQPGMEYIDPQILEKWTEGTKDYRAKLGKEGFNHERDSCAVEMKERYALVKQMNDMGIKLLLSPDASSKFVVPGFGILEEMKLYQKAGLSNYDILRASTVNYALYTQNENAGTIEIGKDADFIMLDDNPLENLNTLAEIGGLFFKNKFLSKTDLQNLGTKIKFK